MALAKEALYEQRTAPEYQSGVGIDIGNPELTAPPKKKRKTRDRCNCGATDHKTSRSLSCRLNKTNIARETAGEEKREELSSTELCLEIVDIRKTRDRCKCGATDHKTSRSLSCRLNKKNIARETAGEEKREELSSTELCREIVDI